jgi:hypothetical protein
VFPHDYWFEKGELFVGETPAMAWTSTKTSPPSIPTSRPTCPSPPGRRHDVELVSMGAPAGQIVCLGEGMLELTGADA